MRSPRSRKTAELSKSLHRQLNSYALAASAAGVGVLALAQPTEARIIYTPAHKNVTIGEPFYFDLNNDSINDFFLSLQTLSRFGQRLYVQPVGKGNEIWISTAIAGGKNCAYPVKRGSVIGHSRRFAGGKHYMFDWYSGSPLCGWIGLPTRAYLGLKFLIKGKYHYGWARFVTDFYAPTAKLTGYAYETVPNKPIIAGKTHGPDVIVTHATLGDLAAGRR